MIKNFTLAIIAFFLLGCSNISNIKPQFANTTNKKIKIYYVHRDGCPACSYMDSVLKNQEIKTIINRDFKLITVDYREQSSKLPKKSMITFKTPTLYFLDSNNKEVSKPVHALSVEDFKKKLKSIST